jgi:hypothetical protein
MPARIFTCPECLHVTKDYDLAGLGWCDLCSDFTGRCGAGTRLYVADFTSGGDWQARCTWSWTAPWELARPGREPLLLRLCDEHGRNVRLGHAPLRGQEVADEPAPGGR